MNSLYHIRKIKLYDLIDYIQSCSHIEHFDYGFLRVKHKGYSERIMIIFNESIDLNRLKEDLPQDQLYFLIKAEHEKNSMKCYIYRRSKITKDQERHLDAIKRYILNKHKHKNMKLENKPINME